MCACLEGITNVAYPVSIISDLNFPKIDWISIEMGTSITANKFLSQIRDLGLRQIVTAPSRGDNFLDVILINNPMNLLNMSVVEPIVNYDHIVISFKIWCPCSCNNNCNIQNNFYNADFGSFSNYLSSFNWDIVFVNCNSTNECWLNLKPYFKKKFPMLFQNTLKNQSLKPINLSFVKN